MGRILGGCGYGCGFTLSPFSRKSITIGVEVILPDIHDIMPSVGAFVAARISSGGCSTSSASGIFFWINTSGYWSVTKDLGTILDVFIMSLFLLYFSW